MRLRRVLTAPSTRCALKSHKRQKVSVGRTSLLVRAGTPSSDALAVCSNRTATGSADLSGWLHSEVVTHGVTSR